MESKSYVGTGENNEETNLSAATGRAPIPIKTGEPVMLVKGVTYLEDGRAIEVEESHFRAEAIEFIIELGEYSQYARLRSHDLLQRRKSVPSKAIASTVRR